MFFRNVNKNSPKWREQYLRDLQIYLKHNSFVIVQRINNGVLSGKNIAPQEVKRLLGKHYPKAKWIDRSDDLGQIVCLFQEIGYTSIMENSEGIQYKTDEMRSAIIKNYINNNSKEIMDRLTDCCQITNGKISYDQMQEVLGFDSSKIDRDAKENVDYCVLLFLRGTKLPFKYNDTHIYLP